MESTHLELTVASSMPWHEQFVTRQDFRIVQAAMRILPLTKSAFVLLVAGLLALPAAGSAADTEPALRQNCGRVDGTLIIAFNLSCRRADHIWRSASGGSLPRGWVGANRDAGGGEALLYRKRDSERVLGALDRNGGLVRSKLGRHAPVVLAHVPYG